MMRRPTKRLRRAPASGASSDPFPDIAGPAGSTSLVANFGAMNGVDGVLLHYDTEDRGGDPLLMAYRKKRVGDGLTSVTVTDLASNTYYWVAAGYVGAIEGDASQQRTTASA